MPSPGKHKIDKTFARESSSHKNPYFTILVLDSNYVLDSTLEDFLKAQGYAVLLAGSALEAVYLTHRFLPDMVLLDCELKGSNCLSLLPELVAENPKAKIILLANRPSVSNVAKAIELGAVDFFSRPLDLERLQAVIDRHKTICEGPSAQ